MKFIHIADLHLDTPLFSLKNNRDLIKKRRTEQRQVISDVINKIKAENIDFLFVSGDLFEQKFVEKSTIEFLISSFELIPNTKIFVSPGNHDPYIKASPYCTFDWPENVTIFTDKISKVSLEDIDVYGIGFNDYEFCFDEIKNLKIENEDKVNVLVMHGTLNGSSKKYFDVKESDLKKFDYVALGHIHEKKVDDSKIIYPGSLLSIGFDELGEHGMVIRKFRKE